LFWDGGFNNKVNKIMAAIDYLPLLVSILIMATIYGLSRQYFHKKVEADRSYRYFRQLYNTIFAVIALVTIIAASPLTSELKGQILGLIGIVTSGAIALSSTSFLGNMLAGMALRMNNNFKSGDFIQVNEYFGKVSSRTLLNVEIQTIDRGLITIPNNYLVSSPIKVLPSSGVFINVELSLGYDIPRSKIETALAKAAEELSIENSYLEVKQLLDHAIVYIFHALITDMERYFSTRSNLHAAIIDKLHEVQIEIVSPKFINSRVIDKSPILPKVYKVTKDDKSNIDELLFEKANLADKIELLKEKIEAITIQLKEKDLSEKRLMDLEQRRLKLLEKLKQLEDNAEEF
jgi:small-conductance mechanosensitive channel